MTATFKGLALFSSGPHRFLIGATALNIVPNYILELPGSGTTATGPRELTVTIEGRLVAATEGALEALRSAIAAQVTYPPSPGLLKDTHGREYVGMSLTSFRERAPIDRGRTLSLPYRATFRRFLT